MFATRLLFMIVGPILAATALAQQDDRITSIPVDTPSVSEDRRVTFTLAAPEADKVVLENTTGGWTGSAWPDGDRVAMSKDENGVWSVTIGPLDPEFYNYAFIVDGLYVIDPVNPLVVRDGVRYRSQLEVTGEKTANYEYRAVPHGTVAHIYVPYPSLGIEKRTTVYTPPGYENGTERYPVLYLQHGGGGDEDIWRDLGRVPEIMDNLIAQGKAKPMIVILSNTYFDQIASRDYIPVLPPRGSGDDPLFFPPAMVSDLIPFIDRTYRSKANAENRAITGLSRGGMLSFVAAFNYIDEFTWVGSFAGGFPLLPGASVDIPPPPNASELRGPDLTETIDPKKTLELMPQLNEGANEKLDLLYVSVGARDGLVSAHRTLRDILDAQNVEFEYIEVPFYGHEWPYWRVAYQDFVQKIFLDR